MDPWVRLESLLETDAVGIGCAENLDLVHAYAEKLVAGDDPEATFSALIAHLDQCPPCAEDLRGLVLAVREALGPEQ